MRITNKIYFCMNRFQYGGALASLFGSLCVTAVRMCECVRANQLVPQQTMGLQATDDGSDYAHYRSIILQASKQANLYIHSPISSRHRSSNWNHSAYSAHLSCPPKTHISLSLNRHVLLRPSCLPSILVTVYGRSSGRTV